MLQLKTVWPLLLIWAIAALFFIPFLGAVHLFDWDEINFAESAREMLVTGDYSKVQIDYHPFWEKPPLFFWLQAMSMQVFGVNEFAARFPNAVTGITTLVTFFLIGRKLYDEKFGWLWALSMLGSFLPHLYFKSGIIDPVFNYFIFLGMWFAARLLVEKKATFALLSGLCIGLATLTKGPVALLIMLLAVAVYWITIRLRKMVSLSHLLIFSLSFACTAAIWFAIDIYENGIGFLAEFIWYQLDLFLHPVAGHGEPFYYHFVVVLLGCFPISIIAMPALVRNKDHDDTLLFRKWMLILFWVVLILFSVVKTKIVHYSSLTYFPLSFLAAYTIHRYLTLSKEFPRWQTSLILFFGIVFALLLTTAPYLAQHSELIIPYIKDPFAVDCLKTPVNWNGIEPLIGTVYGILVITSCIFIFRKKRQVAMVLLFFGTALTLLVYLKMVVPKIEHYSQGPAIEFYESLQGKDVYVTTFGFKSYAQYFYFRKQPGSIKESRDNEWLVKGNIDKPAYFVAKSTSRKEIEQIPGVMFLYQKGGFAFYERSPYEH
jgi:hypothetical protein